MKKKKGTIVEKPKNLRFYNPHAAPMHLTCLQESRRSFSQTQTFFFHLFNSSTSSNVKGKVYLSMIYDLMRRLWLVISSG